MLGGADNPNGELLSYIIGADTAEPAGAVSGCRYGPMSEKPGLQRPFRSRRLCRAVTCAPCTPDGV
ncbi:hypothetical protein [Escherichia coli]|uniref:hypothetical protein n=1 Tax=Escherichia coli TaxID=562 RepID=UPI0015F0F98D|nr:hypothetical protein [Escherichia coli]